MRDENDDDTMLGKMHDEKNTKEGGGVWCGQLALGAWVPHSGVLWLFLSFLVFSWSFLCLFFSFSSLFFSFSFLLKQKKSIRKV